MIDIDDTIAKIASELDDFTELQISMMQRRAKVMLVVGLCWCVFAGFMLGLVLGKLS
jgi:hypothetical protein